MISIQPVIIFFIFSLKYDQYKVIHAWLSNYVRVLDNTLDQE